MILSYKHFCGDLSHETSRALFKESISSISLAISSYCNRQCAYCPNSIADRKSHRHYLSDGLFFNVLRQLCAIDYSGTLHLHRYNEPLADRDYALARIRDVRVFVPKAKIKIFTNGDNLDRPYFEEIAALGVDEIFMTVHAGAGGKTDMPALLAEQRRRMALFGLDFKSRPDNPLEQKFSEVMGHHARGLKLGISASDFYRGQETGETWAFDRGGLISVARKYVRHKPCVSQFMEMEIEWDGTLYPCCQIHGDAFPHDDYVLGKLTEDSDLFCAWTSMKYAEWRLKMSTAGPKGQPCTTCSYGTPSGDNAGEVLQALEKMHAKVIGLSLRQAQADQASASASAS